MQRLPLSFCHSRKPAVNKYILILLSVSLMIACHKSGGHASNTAFPNQIGDRWVYKYSPSGSAAADTGTVQVDIVGQLILPDGESAKIWVTKYSNDPGYSDTTLVVDSASTVKIYFNNICPICTNKMPQERKRFNFPLQVSDVWINAFYHDTTKVLAELSVQVPAGNFPNTFQVARTVAYVTNSFTQDTTFITPAVGITKYLQREFSLGFFPGNGLWELASYQLK
jgi:hypothetical protein